MFPMRSLNYYKTTYWTILVDDLLNNLLDNFVDDICVQGNVCTLGQRQVEYQVVKLKNHVYVVVYKHLVTAL